MHSYLSSTLPQQKLYLMMLGPFCLGPIQYFAQRVSVKKGVSSFFSQEKFYFDENSVYTCIEKDFLWP